MGINEIGIALAMLGLVIAAIQVGQALYLRSRLRRNYKAILKTSETELAQRAKQALVKSNIKLEDAEKIIFGICASGGNHVEAMLESVVQGDSSLLVQLISKAIDEETHVFRNYDI